MWAKLKIFYQLIVFLIVNKKDSLEYEILYFDWTFVKKDNSNK